MEQKLTQAERYSYQHLSVKKHQLQLVHTSIRDSLQEFRKVIDNGRTLEM